VRPRIDWPIVLLQAACYAVVQAVFSANEAVRMALGADVLARLLPGLLLILCGWLIGGLVLAAGAQWTMATMSRRGLRVAIIVPLVVVTHGPINVLLMQQLFRSGDLPQLLPIAPSLFMFWRAAMGSVLFFSYCLMMQGSRERRRELSAVEYGRVELEATVREARAGAIQRSIDPALLEQSLAALQSAYGRDRRAGEALLDALVEYLRLAMPSIRSGLPVHADAAVQTAWRGLRQQLARFPVAALPLPDAAAFPAPPRGEVR
jgi:hypothetical protein